MTKGIPLIRAAEFSDAESVFALIKSYPHELLQRSISDIVKDIDRVLVAELNGKIVGTVSWQILPEIGAPRQPSVEIKSLAVRSHERKSGIGRALVQAAIERIRRFHPVQIVALTFSPGFFAKVGFKEIPKVKLMHKIYMGCINCTKYDSPFTCPEIAMALELPPAKKAGKAGRSGK